MYHEALYKYFIYFVAGLNDRNTIFRMTEGLRVEVASPEIRSIEQVKKWNKTKTPQVHSNRRKIKKILVEKEFLLSVYNSN